jgi:hypothetical protein
LAFESAIGREGTSGLVAVAIERSYLGDLSFYASHLGIRLKEWTERVPNAADIGIMKM